MKEHPVSCLKKIRNRKASEHQNPTLSYWNGFGFSFLVMYLAFSTCPPPFWTLLFIFFCLFHIWIYAPGIFHLIFFPVGFIQCSVIQSLGRRTDAFTWPSVLWHFLKCLPNLSSREQPLLLALGVFSVEWVKQRLSQGTTDDPQHNILQLNTEGLTENKISVIE